MFARPVARTAESAVSPTASRQVKPGQSAAFASGVQLRRAKPQPVSNRRDLAVRATLGQHLGFRLGLCLKCPGRALHLCLRASMNPKRSSSSRKPKVTPADNVRSTGGRAEVFRRWSRWVWGGAVLALVALAAVWVKFKWLPAEAPSDRSAPIVSKSADHAPLAEFVGAEACAECHQHEYEVWRQSTHGRAGGAPEEVTLVAPFDGRPLTFRDGVVTPTKTAQGEPVFVVEEEGRPRQEFKVAAVVGGGYMVGGGTQSFFAKWPDGTLRFLPFDFIRREKLWFAQLKHDNTWSPIGSGMSLAEDLVNWPPSRVLGTHGDYYNCQNCHGSQVLLVRDEATRQMQTHYQTLRIDCESCHGPGRRHADLMNQPEAGEMEDIGMTALETLDKDTSLRVCFQCHATKDALSDDPYLPGARFEDFFSLKLPVLEDTFTVDGRVRSFSYQSGHLYSDCYLNGSMTCVDCHDPHAQDYRDVFGLKLTGRFDNGQCTGCHASQAKEPERHSHHRADSPGNLCTSCHMPFLQHQGVGTRLSFARSDHSIPIPRPAFDRQLGIENACQKCHSDRDLAWQERWMEVWYGELKPHPTMVANVIRAAGMEDARDAAPLLLASNVHHPMAQMAGLIEFYNRFLPVEAETTDPEVVERLKALAWGADLDLKSAALMGLDIGYGRDPDVAAFLEQQRSQLGGEEMAVRRRWSALAFYTGNAYAAAGALPQALRCYEKALKIRPDNVAVMSNLALAYLKAGDGGAAIEWLRRAIRAQPSRTVFYVQLARTYSRLRRISEARQVVEEGLVQAPQDEELGRLRLEFSGTAKER